MSIHTERANGQYASGEGSLSIYDTRYKWTDLKAVVWVHGFGGDETQAILAGQSRELSLPLAQMGYYIYSISAGGTSTFGNATAVTAVGNAVNYLRGLGFRSISAIGYSAGASCILNYVSHNRDTHYLSSVISIAGAVDLNDIYTNDRGGYAAALNSAYGGSWTANGFNANPAYSPRKAAGSARFRNLPQLVYYSANDGVCKNQAAYVNNCTQAWGSPATLIEIPTDPQHSVAPMFVPVADIAAWLEFN